MDVGTMGGLAVLALIDSTSFGTLALPLIMLARPRVAVRPYLFYLLVISGFYAALGVALLAGPDADLRVVAGVALAAGLVEAASMVPYLGAVGILAGARLPWPFAVATLLAYVVVMALPALLLLCARLAVGDRAFGPLQRLKAWIERNADDTLAWILGIVGFLLAADAAGRLAAAAEVGASCVP